METRRGKVLARFHVIDTPDDEKTRATVDVKEIAARDDLAQRPDFVAVDPGHSRLGQAGLECG
jgi:hypothetical protein